MQKKYSKKYIEYEKLVRDKIPEIIKADGGVPTTYVANEEEYKKSLLAKLVEEVTEFVEEPNREEMSDILEVIYAVCELMHWDIDEIQQIRKKKTESRGSFHKRIILKSVKR